VRKFRVYLSGPISGRPIDEVRRAFNRGEEKAERQIGRLFEGVEIVAINPLKKDLPYEAPWEEHMAEDIKLLAACDAVLMLEGWHTSKGARIERYIANTLHKLVLYEAGKKVIFGNGND